MPLQRQLQYHYRSFSYSLRTIALPTWLDSVGARLICMAVVVLFGIFYVLQISAAAASGYEINKLEKQTALLSEEIQKLDTEIAVHGAMPSITKRLPSLGLVAVSRFQHLKPTGAAMALR